MPRQPLYDRKVIVRAIRRMLAFGRPFADPDAAARKLVEIANAAEAVQDGRMIYDSVSRYGP
jgi:hypothetical protein